MKKILTLAFLTITFYGVNAQSKFQHEVIAHLPIGESKDISSFGISIKTDYLFELSGKFKLGPSVGYSYFFGETTSFDLGDVILELDVDNFQFLPVAAAAQYYFTPKLSLRVDLGYAISLNGGDGGIYFSPKLGYDITDKLGVKFGYSRITHARDVDLDFNTIDLGLAFSF